LRIQSSGIDPASGRPDPHGIPQIACPARRGEVNPQFTCLSCPCAASLEYHDAVDDRGLPFRVVDAVQCSYRERESRLPVSTRPFPNALRPSAMATTLPRPAVACPLLRSPERIAPLAAEVDGKRWVPLSTCRSCQFYRGAAGEPAATGGGAAEPATVLCAAPETE
jgi:hypothetical protein